MLSRVADSLYWMSRYLERADHNARVLESNYNSLLNPAKESRVSRWNSITRSLGLDSDLSNNDAPWSLLSFIAQPGNRSSILGSIASARENASQVREQISSEMWERLNRLYHEVTATSTRAEFGSEPIRFLSLFREGAYAFHGVTESTIPHGEAWHFIQLGKYIERADGICAVLDASYSSPEDADDLDWIGLLTSCSALDAFRKVHTASLKAECVIEFLLLDPDFPHTVRYSIERVQYALSAIASLTLTRHSRRIERMIGTLRSSLAYVQIEEVMARDLHSYLIRIREQCKALHRAVHEVYIDYPPEAVLEN
ncbi:MAG TPA: alpha-E domain-containing protein [Bryobacteraceae bacterium]|jgi:uncharacterized alpha-E superfamily protein|nr:alpha-E domain-containing protein [Bryobacteraceae bacterium]